MVNNNKQNLLLRAMNKIKITKLLISKEMKMMFMMIEYRWNDSNKKKIKKRMNKNKNKRDSLAISQINLWMVLKG